MAGSETAHEHTDYSGVLLYLAHCKGMHQPGNLKEIHKHDKDREKDEHQYRSRIKENLLKVYRNDVCRTAHQHEKIQNGISQYECGNNRESVTDKQESYDFLGIILKKNKEILDKLQEINNEGTDLMSYLVNYPFERKRFIHCNYLLNKPDNTEIIMSLLIIQEKSRLNVEPARKILYQSITKP